MKCGMLNTNAKYMINRMGHRDLLAVVDAGFNVPKDVELVDLALLPNIPTLEQVLQAVLLEASVEKVYLAEEIKEQAPEMLETYYRLFPGVEFEFMPHVPNFDNMVASSRGAIRSGQFNYHAANCVLKIACEY